VKVFSFLESGCSGLRRYCSPPSEARVNMLSARLRQAVTKGSRPIISRNCASSRLTPPRLISTTPTIIQKTSLPLHLTTPISTPYRHYSGSTITPQEQEQGVEMSSGEKDIHDILAKAFTPTTLQVQDVSGESCCNSFERY
jgi:hypothetical protein